MIASGTIIIDGQTYRKGDVIHDLGGWDCLSTRQIKAQTYRGKNNIHVKFVFEQHQGICA